MMNIIGKTKIWYSVSMSLICISIVALIVFGIKPGADFVGGTLVEVGFNKNVSADDIQKSLKDLNLPSLSVSNTERNSVLIKTAPIERGEIDRIISTLKANLIQNNNLGITQVEERQAQTIGPTVGKNLTKRAIIAVILTIIAIVLYIAWSFRRVQKPFSSWSMSAATIIALIHDVVFTLGFVSLINHFYGFEANSYLLVALLTVLGFSVHDTIVVFDRIRENLLHASRASAIATIVNESVNQTLARSLNTSLTVLLILLALASIGGSSIRPFVLTLLAGIAVGTYSSIFIASPLLVTWSHIKNRRTSKTGAGER
jgi:preprotein translocase subunit SecF